MGDLAELRDEVDFYVLYVREAHPGFNVPEHKSIDGKRAQAQRVIDEERDGVSEDDRSLVGKVPNLPQIASNAVSAAALLIAGVLWLGQDVTPGWPGWLAAAAGLILSLRAR